MVDRIFLYKTFIDNDYVFTFIKPHNHYTPWTTTDPDFLKTNDIYNNTAIYHCVSKSGAEYYRECDISISTNIELCNATKPYYIEYLNKIKSLDNYDPRIPMGDKSIGLVPKIDFDGDIKFVDMYIRKYRVIR